MSERITLIGAGLAGSLLAIHLARRGFEVTVYERHPDMRKVPIPAGRSINLALANRGIAALDAVGLMPRIESLLLPMRGRMLHAVDGTLDFQPYGRTPNEVIHSVSRGLLNTALMDAAEETGRVRFEFGHRCDGYDFDTGALEMTDTASGERATSDCPALIATDGAGSPIRAAMAAQRGIEVSESLIEHGYKELAMPPGGDGRHAMAADALHIWPRGGFMLIALPNLDGSFTVTLFLQLEGDPAFSAMRSAGDVEGYFARYFPDAVALIPGLAQQFLDNPTGRMGTVTARPWHVGGQALLAGDAAHAIVPFHGQGMNCAFEDCSVLDACLDRHGADWARVFAAFEAARKPDTDAIAEMALENFVEMRDLVAQPRFQLQKQLGFELEARHPGRFIPRYAMVMFHTLPYAEAQRRGAVQQRILDELTEGVARIEDVDMDKADSLIEEFCDW